MPNRYGEDEAVEALSPAERAEFRARAIADCGLCDNTGYRGSAVCSHTDHAAAARRGMDMIRETMGWQK